MSEALLANAVAHKAVAAAVGLSGIAGGGATLEATGVGPAVREAVGIEAPANAPSPAGGTLDTEALRADAGEAAVTAGEGLGTAESALDQARDRAPDSADFGLHTAAEATANAGDGLATAADAIAAAHDRAPEQAAAGLYAAVDAAANAGSTRSAPRAQPPGWRTHRSTRPRSLAGRAGRRPSPQRRWGCPRKREGQAATTGTASGRPS